MADLDSKSKDMHTSMAAPVVDVVQGQEDHAEPISSAPADIPALQRVFVRAVWFSAAFALIVGIIVPMPLFGTEYIFSRRSFEVWVA
jgi:hypothetical protein